LAAGIHCRDISRRSGSDGMPCHASSSRKPFTLADAGRPRRAGNDRPAKLPLTLRQKL
jgi:hypothetical protein